MSASARSKLFLSRYGMVLAIVVFIVGLGLIGMAWQTYADPPSTVTTEEVDTESYAVSSQTQAVVDPAVDPELYTPGTILQDMPVYFFNESPVLTVIVLIDTPEGMTVDVDTRLTIEYQATRDGQVFWDRTELLAFEETSVRGGEVRLEGSQDMREVREELARVSDRVGGAGSVDANIVLDIEYESDRYEGHFSTESELIVTSHAYWLDEELADERTESRTVTSEVTLDPDMGEVSLLAIAGLAMMLLALLVLWTIRRGIDTEEIETELARAEHAEWISHGEIPTRGDKDYVAIDSLVDLVDVAIDSNRRVIYDDGIDTYAVVEGDLVYFYSPSREEIEEWLGV